jgi:hypothetical protein
MMPDMDSRMVMWGEVLRPAIGNRHLSREQRFELYREIHAINVLPPEVVFSCMDSEIARVKEDRREKDPSALAAMEVLPSDKTYEEWKKVKKAVYQKAVGNLGRATNAEEVCARGWSFFDDVIRNRPLSWQFGFRNPDSFSTFTDPDPGRCWFCGNAITPKSLIVSRYGSGWKELFSGSAITLVGGPICARCLSDSPGNVAARAATHIPEREKRKAFSYTFLRNRSFLPSRMEKITSFSKIHGYEVARALLGGAPHSKKDKKKAA